ncbi:MAG: phosphoglucosamine mutase, partial [Armatimonadota bacterium]|nr:phosphoglucosamine mutase [Armatimonadota bacterium]
IEALTTASQEFPRATGRAIGQAWDLPQGEEEYLSYLLAHARGKLEGWRIVVDCAYGASYRIAPRLWEALGARVIALHDEPDGARINVACGSTHPEVLQKAVREHGADLGFSHDGDADRVIAVDERGEVVDGDRILGICALHLHALGRLPGKRVVGTVMSNLGLEKALARAGIVLERTKVGDRYVLEKMRELNAPLGGEQSGHIIFLEYATTGDGLLTALQLVNVMLETGKRLSDLAAPIERFPQVLKNVRVASRPEVERDEEIQEAVQRFASALAGQGRVLVRPSGTEPVVRVMVECEQEEEAEAIAAELVELIQRKYGVEMAGGR